MARSRCGGLFCSSISLFFLQLWLSSCVWAEDDLPCLSGFKNSVGDPFGYLATWNSSNDPEIDTWVGVTTWNDNENKVLSLQLSGAGLSGSLPTIARHLSSCFSLTQLNLSNNNFTGAFPSNFCNGLRYLTVLDLSYNLLEGSIPPNLDDCVYLNNLSLQGNRLSGEIPQQLGNLPRLTNLNLSSNSLSGCIPTSLTNRSTPFDAAVFADNDRLCECPNCPRSKEKVHQLLVIGAPILSAVLLLIVLYWLACWWTGGSIKALLQQLYGKRRSRWPDTHHNFTWEELQHATSFFSPANIIGRGGSSTVYRGSLRNGQEIAVKVLQCEEQKIGMQLQPNQLFFTELKLLGKLRHRNVVKVLGFCYTPESMAIILEYMPAGSLEALLRHEFATSNPAFGWRARLNILLGIAEGLMYLHDEYDSKQSVVHADLKPANVLLDEDMEAHLADFGIATMLSSGINMQSSGGQLGSAFNSTGQVFSTPCWSLGYAAPECVQEGLVSGKADVFSFGVIALELITGESPSSDKFKEGESLVKWVSEALAQKDVDRVLALNLVSAQDKTRWRKDLSALLSMGCSCASIARASRPKMFEVVVFLRRFCKRLDDHVTFQTLDI